VTLIAASHIFLVFVTVPDQKTGRTLTRSILSAHLAACVNLVPGLESHYWWQNKLERSREVLMLIKTTRRHLKGLERLILQKHPYDTPEIVAVPLGRGNSRYLKWLSANVAAGGRV
jgi:periplasmic divalent cation tolerance protein